MNKELLDKLNSYINKSVKKETPIPKVGDSVQTPFKPHLITSAQNLPTFNTMIKWQIPIELCPSCQSRLNGMTPKIFSAWTTVAKGQKVTKTQPKMNKEAELQEEEVY